MPAPGSKRVFLILLASLLLACETPARQPLPALSPNAPEDKPVAVKGKAQFDKVQAAIAPYIEQARQTYPGARERYLRGLPPGHAFFAVTRLRDGTGAFEQVFVAVSAIQNGRIRGRIASDVRRVQGYKHGDPHEFPEAELVDWVISRPDGSEEGNLVGKFLDEWQKTRRP
ncbi:MAG: hypothetical protein QM820_44130 [Minicystis sp.]